jgi:hypothetical protein
MPFRLEVERLKRVDADLAAVRLRPGVTSPEETRMNINLVDAALFLGSGVGDRWEGELP